MTRLIIRAACLAGAAALCLAFSPSARANLVTNGGFETESGTPLLPTGWSVSGTGIASDQSFFNSGNYDVAFTALSSDPNPGTLSQSIATTPGQGYTLSFWLADQSITADADAFNITFGTFSTTISNSNFTPGTYNNIMLSIAGSDVTGASTVLSFQGLLDPTYPDIFFAYSSFNLDDVSLVATTVPEPPAAALFGTAIGLLALLGLAQDLCTRIRQIFL